MSYLSELVFRHKKVAGVDRAELRLVDSAETTVKRNAFKTVSRRYEEIKGDPKARLSVVMAEFLAIPGAITASIVTKDPNISGGVATAITGLLVYPPMTHKILSTKQGIGPSIPAYGADTIVTSTFTVVGFDTHSLPLILADLGCIVFSAPGIPLVFSQQLHAAKEKREALKAVQPIEASRFKRLASDPVVRFYAASMTPFAIAAGAIAGSIVARAPSDIPGAIGTIAAPFVYLAQSRRSAKLMKTGGLEAATSGISPAAYSLDASAQSNWLAYAAMKNIPTLVTVQVAIMAGWAYPFSLAMKKMVRDVKGKVTHKEGVQ